MPMCLLLAVLEGEGCGKGIGKNGASEDMIGSYKGFR